ncbi:MAG: RsmB/NOP family class I SAM-dependent RNA methyltransferase [Opitutus sp.]
MHDSPTLNHAARILAAAARDNAPADVALRHYFLEARQLGPALRRGISRTVFAYFRWLQWLNPKTSLQRQLAQAGTLQERFNADEKSVKPETLAVRAVPGWLAAEMDLPAAYLRQLQREPALWLRTRPGTAAKLAAELGECELAARDPGLKTPMPVPDALRCTGTQDLFRTPAFQRGAFEIQDLASQLVSLAAAPRPGETWWDACAGEGGKTLHLAALMGGKGVVWASDRNDRRLQVLKRRAKRAEIFNYRLAPWDGSVRVPTKTRFDGILVDAPCSGVGTWQRNPHARWTATPRDVAELAVVQQSLLANVAASLEPGGRLIYSVCTLTRSETTAAAEAFSAAHPEFEPAVLFDENPASPKGAAFLWPHEINANGMFIAAWRKLQPPV